MVSTRKTIFFLLLLVFAGVYSDSLIQASPGETNSYQLPQIYRVSCLNEKEGCPCFQKPEENSDAVERVYHYQVLYNPIRKNQGWYRVVLVDPFRIADAKASKGSFPGNLASSNPVCYLPAHRLRKKVYSPVLTNRFRKLDHSPLPLNNLVDFENTDPGGSGSRAVDEGLALEVLNDARKVSIGDFWPTYYHQAIEDYHPGPDVRARSKNGKVVLRASREFLRQVIWEGSGIASDGTRIRYTGGKWFYTTYQDAHWGHGAADGYHLYPYRSLAVHYPGICRKLSSRPGGDCKPEDAHGLMVYVPRIAKLKIPMDDGRPHDGYFCMTDSGAPYYIRPDRVDLFVGAHGGGNPYLPPERRQNRLLDGGIEPVVPWDWRLWGKKGRAWCKLKDLPEDPKNPKPEDCAHDYHTVAHKKRLEMQVLVGEDGKLIKCKKGMLGPGPPVPVPGND